MTATTRSRSQTESESVTINRGDLQNIVDLAYEFKGFAVSNSQIDTCIGDAELRTAERALKDQEEDVTLSEETVSTLVDIAYMYRGSDNSRQFGDRFDSVWAASRLL